MKRKRKLWRNRRGQGLTEYALLICLVSLGLILMLGRFRNAIGNSLKNSTTAANSVSTIAQAGTGGGTNGNNNNGNGNNGNGNNGNGNNRRISQQQRRVTRTSGPIIFGNFIIF